MNIQQFLYFSSDYWKKVKSAYKPWPIRLETMLESMKWLGVFLLPPGWDAGPLQGYTQH